MNPSTLAACALILTASPAIAQTATVYLTATQDGQEITEVNPGETFTINATATGDRSIFAFNLRVGATLGQNKLDFLSNFRDNPDGHDRFFGAASGAGIIEDEFAVDRRDATASFFTSQPQLPLDDLVFFSFDVTLKDTAGGGLVRFGSEAGSGPVLQGALQYAFDGGFDVYNMEDYPNVSFDNLDIRVVPAPASIAALGLAVLAARRRRQQAARSRYNTRARGQDAGSSCFHA